MEKTYNFEKSCKMVEIGIICHTKSVYHTKYRDLCDTTGLNDDLYRYGDLMSYLYDIWNELEKHFPNVSEDYVGYITEWVNNDEENILICIEKYFKETLDRITK